MQRGNEIGAEPGEGGGVVKELDAELLANKMY